jgi:hypothetical protein
MKMIYNVLFIASLLFTLFIGSAIAFGPGGPGPGGPGPGGPGPGGPGPGGPGPGGPGPGGPGPGIPVIAIDQIKDKICFMRSANTIKSCVNSCPTLDMQQKNPDLEGAICIAKCIESFATSIERCL